MKPKNQYTTSRYDSFENICIQSKLDTQLPYRFPGYPMDMMGDRAPYGSFHPGAGPAQFAQQDIYYPDFLAAHNPVSYISLLQIW